MLTHTDPTGIVKLCKAVLFERFSVENHANLLYSIVVYGELVILAHTVIHSEMLFSVLNCGGFACFSCFYSVHKS